MILDEIKAENESLSRIKLKEVTVSPSRGEAVFDFVSNTAVSADAKEKIVKILKKYVPETFSSVSVNFTKLVADGELVKKSVLDYFKTEFLSVSSAVNDENVTVEVFGDLCRFTISADDGVCAYMEANDVISRVSAHLSDIYCADFDGKAVSTGKAEYDDGFLRRGNVSEIERATVRTFKVSDVVKLWGEEISGEATYIADGGDVLGEAIFAGKVVQITEKTTKNGKAYYVIDIDDTTGRLSAKAFMTKAKLSKMEKLQVGSEIITRGEKEIFNGFQSYLIRDLSFCVFPKDFKPEEKPEKPVPKEYARIFPQPVVEYSQGGLFEQKEELADGLKDKSFVVVDIETTGIKYFLGDKITEIGAFKIVNGKITESFTTLVNPGVPISEEITKLTGIDDEMVKDKPSFNEVLPDFYKFCYGSTFVAHNIDFDFKFIKYMAKDSGYNFKNDGVDTLALSINTLPRQKNYKLNTVCAFFGIEFLHHRAMSDAYATAKLFLELMRYKKD